MESSTFAVSSLHPKTYLMNQSVTTSVVHWMDRKIEGWFYEEVLCNIMFFTTIVMQGMLIFSSSYPVPFTPFTCTDRTDFFQNLVVNSMI